MSSGSRLMRYDAARRALAEAHRIDEVKAIRDKAVAMQAYAKQAKDAELSRHATEIRLRAERRLGELIAEQPKAKGTRGQLAGKKAGSGTGRGKAKAVSGTVKNTGPEKSVPTLRERGIDENLARRARKAATMPEEKYEAKIKRQTELAEKAASATGKAAYPRAEFTGKSEWYTPAEYIEPAREVLGAIDLDPASSDKAQETVKARRYYTADNDGLALEWHGRVWMNPPYGRDLIQRFMNKLVDEYRSGRVEAAIVLTHNSTETAWFQTAQKACSAICFSDARVRFLDPDGDPCSPSQGQAFFYYGSDPDRFADVFESVGFIVIPRHAVKAILGKASQMEAAE
jgi:phage N-6-adenine-methyltransferase